MQTPESGTPEVITIQTQEAVSPDVIARTDPILLVAIVAIVALAAVASAYLMTRGPDSSPEIARLKWGAAITAVAFVAIVAVFSLAVWLFGEARDVVATVGVITGLMGTVIGTFFGVQVGAAGTQAATEAARAAEQSAAQANLAAQSAAAGRGGSRTP